jgi:hypothetical protein
LSEALGSPVYYRVEKVRVSLDDRLVDICPLRYHPFSILAHFHIHT